MKLSNNLYTLSTISRSFDKYHVDNNKVHLVSSIFYTNNFELNKDTKFNSVHYIIFIELIDLDKFEIIEHNSTCIEFQISLPYFLKFFLGLSSSFESFLEVLIGNSFEKAKENRSLLNNVLFVYKDISWGTIQAIYKNINVDISGGSISKRHVLSTAEYNLSSMLLSLRYNMVDIYNSSIILSKQIQKSKGGDIDNSELSSILSYDLEINKMIRLNTIANFLNLKIGNIKADINSLELEVKSRQGKILFSDDSLKIYSTDTPKIKKLKNNILKSKNKIEKLKQEISSLNSKVTELNSEVSTLPSLSPSELRDKYNNLISGINIRNDVSNFKNYFNKRKIRGVKDLERREYSTVSSLRAVNGNGLLIYKSCNLPIKILTPLINFPTRGCRTTEKREFSLYSNNSLVSENIMRLLYLDARKENIQISIEEYLIFKQNNLYLQEALRANISNNVPHSLQCEIAANFITGISLAANAKIGLEVVKNSPNIGVKATGAIAGGLALSPVKETLTKAYESSPNKGTDITALVDETSSNFISEIYQNNSKNNNTSTHNHSDSCPTTTITPVTLSECDTVTTATHNHNHTCDCDCVAVDVTDLSGFPLNLIDDLIVYNYLSFIFLSLIINALLATYLKEFNIDKYLSPNSNSKTIKILRFIYLRYMKIWSDTSKYLIIYSVIFLFFCLIMSKFCLFLIKNS